MLTRSIIICYFPRQDVNRFGGAVDSAEGAGLMIVGDEFSEIDGCVHVFNLRLRKPRAGIAQSLLMIEKGGNRRRCVALGVEPKTV